MAFSSGTYTLPGAALNTGDTVSATENNTLRNDMASSFNLTWLRNGTAAATANIPMGGFELTNAAAIGSNSSLLLKSNNGTTAVTIDTAQNVGVGVTPSAWQSTRRALQVGSNAALWGNVAGAGTTFLSNNTYFDGTNFKYLNTSGASYMAQQTDGSFTFNSAASGTAGNNVTFTQAMTLDASGNLLVGTTTANGKLSVYGGAVSSSTFMVDIRNGTYVGFRIRDDGFAFLPTTYDKTTASAANMYIDTGGVLYRSTSSLKYKTNVQNATHGLSDVLKLRAVTYEGKTEADTGKTFGGLIAEEVHAAGLTEFVQYAEDGTPDALAYSNMVSLCIKAIQEQQALITNLTERLVALEGK
jgi:hypothetical protein